MLNRSLCRGLTFSLLMIGSGVTYAQDQAPKATPTAAVRAKALLGAKVSVQGGTGVGTIEDIVLNSDGVVDYLIVSDGGKLVSLPWEATKFNYADRAATINITQEQYRQIPTFTTDRYPDFYAPTYRADVYKFYGLPAGQERRLERRQERRP